MPTTPFYGESSKNIVAVIDVDSFEVQVYQKMDEYKLSIGKPTIIVDPTSRRLLSVSPEAKVLNIARNDTEKEARRKCPTIISIVKKVRFDKPDSRPLRSSGFQLRQVILDYLDRVKDEAGSELGGPEMIELWTTKMPVRLNGCDEFFMELTDIVYLKRQDWDSTFMDLEENNRKVILEGKEKSYTGEDLGERIMHLMKEQNRVQKASICYQEYVNQETNMLLAAEMMDGLLQEIKTETGFDCTVGIGSNMVRAKLACKLNKPAAVTAMLDCSLPRIAASLNFREITGLGGDLGAKVDSCFGPMKLIDLQSRVQNRTLNSDGLFTPEEIRKLKDLAYAISPEKVETKLFHDSVSCGKSNLFFRSPSEFKHRLGLLCEEMVERLAEEKEFNKRAPAKLCLIYAGKGMERVRALDFVTQQDGSLRTTPSGLMAECVDKAISKNPQFQAHLCRISEMSLKVSEFRKLGDVYVDEVQQRGQDLFEFIIG